MKINQLLLGRLAIAMAAAYPAFTFAAPPATSAYYTDTQNIYVEDQTTEVMNGLNTVLCYVEAMRPDAMVGNGNYVALVDQNVCNAHGSGGKSTNSGPSYSKGIVNSTTVSDVMVANAWFTEQAQTIYAHITGTQAPSATQPYGIFRVDYCGMPASGPACAMNGYVNATASGLQYFNVDPSGTSQLQLNGATATAGNGKMMSTAGTIFTFAYDANLFRRSDGTSDRCFSRDPALAAESDWSYALYDMTTGAQVTRNSGFPIEYTDAGGIVQNGYVGYSGLWAPTPVPAAATVYQVTYDATGATKTPYTLLQTGGKLTKYTKAPKTLAALDKVTFWYFPEVAIAGVFTVGNGYELYWDNAAKNFVISGDANLATNIMVPRATPLAVTNANMLLAAPWGLFGWSQALGGDFAISANDFANLSNVTTGLSNTPVITHTQDIVYPSDFATALPSGLICVGDCPTAAAITAANATGSVTSPFGATAGQGWGTGVITASLTSYTLNATTGNLIDAASTAVLNTATTGSWASGIYSGRLADKAALDAAKAAANTAVAGSSPAGSYTQSDMDLVNTYYVWETSPQSWNQVAVLKDGAGVNVKFDPELLVNFTVPANTDLVNKTPYGNFAGTTIQLQYGGVGSLWGIPNECIDLTTNAPCTFVGGAPTSTPQNTRWAPDFSIPTDLVAGVVTVASTVGTATPTQYLVKGLDIERRLASQTLATCTAAGLALPVAAGITLPDATGFQDPGPATAATYIGAQPVLNPMPAPRVIHGEVKF